MKNKIIVFTGALMLLSLISSCSSDDNDTNETPSLSIDGVTSAKYKDVKLANREINAVVQNAMSGSSGANRNAKNASNDCITTSSEFTETGATVTLDYGNSCTTSDGKIISGKIVLTYKIKEGSEDFAFDMTYSLENFSFNGITVNGKSIATYNLGDLTTGDGLKFDTTSDYVFIWEDGLEVASTANTSISSVINHEQPDASYSVVTLDTEAKFSTGETLIAKTTSPLRLENECEYVVSGTIITSENEIVSNTLDYGDGTCDNIAIQTDSDGTETTIDLDVEIAENFSI